MAFSDARNERDRAAGDTSGKSSGGGGDKARDAERRNREAMDRRAREVSNSGIMDSGSQRHRNRAAEIARVGAATGTSTTPVGNTGVSPAGRVSSIHQGMARDFRNVGNSDLENFGNTVAGMLGFNEQRPTLSRALDRFNRTPAGEISDKRAGWGFDPAGLIGNALGAPFGAGVITGPIADQISAYFDRPLEIGLGPDVFSGQISAPSLHANTNQLNADLASLGLGTSPKPFGNTSPPANTGQTAGGVPPAGGAAQSQPGQANGSIPTPGAPATSPMNPALSPMPAPTPVRPITAPPVTLTPYGMGQVKLPQPNYFMSQMT